MKKSLFARFINFCLPIVFIVYLLWVLLVNVVAPTTAIYDFFQKPVVSTLTTYKGVILIIYFILVMIANKKFPPWNAVIAFLLLGIYTLLLIYFLPRSRVFIFDDSSVISVSLSLKEQFSYYGPYIVGIIFAFGLFYILPMTGKGHKWNNVVLYFILTVAIVSLAYSYIAEKDLYVRFFNGDYTNKWQLNISSFFGNKNRYGLVLFAGYAVCLAFSGAKKSLAKVFYLLVALFFWANTYVIRCDDAFMAGAVGFLFYLFGYFLTGVKKYKVLSWCGFTLVIGSIIAVIVISSLPEFYENYSVFEKIHSFLGQFSSFTGRVGIWAMYLSHLSPINIFFGQGAIGEYTYMAYDSGTIEAFSLHNGFLDYFNAGGIIFVAFLFVLVVKNFKYILTFKKDNPSLFAALLGLLGAYVIYGFAEVFTPYTARFINTAGVAFILTIFPMGYEKKEEVRDFSI